MKEYIPVVEYILMNTDIDNPITTRDITSALGIKGAKLRAIVNEARTCGIPICSCLRGYYYSEDEEHIHRTIDHLSRRIGKINSAIEGLSGIHNEVRTTTASADSGRVPSDP